jgi:hypothetical protein
MESILWFDWALWEMVCLVRLWHWFWGTTKKGNGKGKAKVKGNEDGMIATMIFRRILRKSEFGLLC